jgi:hypothetical protein
MVTQLFYFVLKFLFKKYMKKYKCVNGGMVEIIKWRIDIFPTLINTFHTKVPDNKNNIYTGCICLI